MPSVSPFALSQALLRAGDAWTQMVERFLQERFGLSYAQFAVLDLVQRHPGLRQGDLARRLGRTKGNMTGVVGRLEEAGLLRRDSVPGDRRAYALNITEKGRFVTLVAPELRSFTQDVLGDLDPEERAILARGLEKLARALDDTDWRPPAEEATAAVEAPPDGTESTGAPQDGDDTPAAPALDDDFMDDEPPVLVDRRRHVPVRLRRFRGERETRQFGPGLPPWPGDEW